MKKLILIIFPIALYVVAVFAATKASVGGHPYKFINMSVFLFVAFIPSLLMFFQSRFLESEYQKTVHRCFIFSIISIVTAMFTLPLVEHCIDASLVSNRSYGSIFWNGVLILIGYKSWKYISDKRAKVSSNR